MIEKARSLGYSHENLEVRKDGKLQNIFGAVYATAEFINHTYPEVKQIYYIGSGSGLIDELAYFDISVQGPQDSGKELSTEEMENLQLNENVGAVVTTVDHSLNY